MEKLWRKLWRWSIIEPSRIGKNLLRAHTYYASELVGAEKLGLQINNE
jgi:hypothetical protein